MEEELKCPSPVLQTLSIEDLWMPLPIQHKPSTTTMEQQQHQEDETTTLFLPSIASLQKKEEEELIITSNELTQGLTSDIALIKTYQS